MQGNSRRGTSAEVRLRSTLHRMGLRFTVDQKVGVGRAAPRPDILFSSARVAVFVDGCFWHGCPEHGTRPRANEPYWSAKMARNRRRDEANNEALEALGWRVVRVWEHEDPRAAAAAIRRIVASRRPTGH